MRTFSKAFFGGYQRDEVDDYVYATTCELDRLKERLAAMQQEMDGILKGQAEGEDAAGQEPTVVNPPAGDHSKRYGA